MSYTGKMPKPSMKRANLEEREADLYYALADRARTLRGRNPQLTLAKCGDLMGVTESMASLKFKGRKWSAFEVRVMADAFGVKTSVLYGDDPMPEPTRPAIISTIDTGRNVGRMGLEPMTDGSWVAPVTPIGRVS